MSYKTDKLYGRQGGRFRDEGAEPTLDGPPCNVCGRPMIVGQKLRHGVCSPPLACCGWPEDLVGDRAKHAAQHAEVLP